MCNISKEETSSGNVGLTTLLVILLQKGGQQCEEKRGADLNAFLDGNMHHVAVRTARVAAECNWSDSQRWACSHVHDPLWRVGQDVPPIGQQSKGRQS